MASAARVVREFLSEHECAVLDPLLDLLELFAGSPEEARFRARASFMLFYTAVTLLSAQRRSTGSRAGGVDFVDETYLRKDTAVCEFLIR